MIVELGDILVWKDWEGRIDDSPSPEIDEYFVVVDIDRRKEEPYTMLNLSRGGYETFTGLTFYDSQFWERVA